MNRDQERNMAEVEVPLHYADGSVKKIKKKIPQTTKFLISAYQDRNRRI